MCLVAGGRRCGALRSQRGRRVVGAAEQRRQACDAQRQAADQRRPALQRLLAGHRVRDHHPAVACAAAGCPRSLEHRVQRRLPCRAGQNEGQPREHEHDVRPRKYGYVCQLAVRNRTRLSARPSEAASRVWNPSRTSTPIAISASATPRRPGSGTARRTSGRESRRAFPRRTRGAASRSRSPIQGAGSRFGELLPARVDERCAEEQAKRDEGRCGVDAPGHAPDATHLT